VNIRAGSVIVTLVLLIAGTVPARAAAPTPTAKAATAISVAYAKSVLRRYINNQYNVVRGPYFSGCMKLAGNWVRCDIDFRAGLYARCARGSVKAVGSIDHIKLNAPIC
jgi:hypothetical protein